MEKRLKNILSISLIILAINLIWEFSHYFLYIDMSGISPTPHLIIASLGDVFFIWVIFAVISLKNQELNWIYKPSRQDYSLIILLGVILAIAIELNGLSSGRWAYVEMMPTIFNIGLTPLIQLFTTAIIAIRLNGLFNKHL